MFSTFDYLTVVEDNDLICAGDGRKSMAAFRRAISCSRDLLGRAWGSIALTL